MKHETVIPIYNIPIFMTDKSKSLDKRIQVDVPDYEGGRKSYGRCAAWPEEDGQCRIGIYASNTSAVAHEAVHAANEVFSIIGQKPSLKNDECYAYLVEWIVKEFIGNVKVKQTGPLVI